MPGHFFCIGDLAGNIDFFCLTTQSSGEIFRKENQILRQDLELSNSLTWCVHACTLCLSVAARAEIFLGIKLTS